MEEGLQLDPWLQLFKPPVSHISGREGHFKQFNNSYLFWRANTQPLQLTTEFMSSGAAGIPLAGQAIVGTLGAIAGAAASMASNCTV